MYYRAYSSHQAKICINGSWVALGVPRVTTLPSNPADGDEVYYAPTSITMSPASPAGHNAPYLTWHLRFSQAAHNADGYGWVVVSGSAIKAFNDALASTGATTPQDLGTGPSITIPQAGIWDVTVGGRVRSEQASTWTILSYVFPGGGTAVLSDGIGVSSGGATNIGATGMTTKRKTISSTGAIATRYWRLGGSGTVYFETRVLEAMPVRLKS